LALGGWLGAVWQKRIQESERAQHATELERLRSNLEMERSQRQRISEEQFKLYSEVWANLQDLKTIADRLWEKVSADRFHDFVTALEQACKGVDRGRLILRETLYDKLQEALKIFQNYELGKARLIEIRSRKELDDHYLLDPEEYIQEQIGRNAEHKRDYESILEDVVRQFRQELGIPS
jgi:hypothetical protein